MTTYLTTGCAGFIGTTFVHYMLSRYTDIKIINLDALTYAGTVNENGVVTALAEGTVTIFATSGNGKTDSYKVEITKRPVITRNSSSRSSGSGSNYCLNLNIKKFHRPSCGDIKKMKESNKQYTDADRDTIIGWGYSPCGHCKP